MQLFVGTLKETRPLTDVVRPRGLKDGYHRGLKDGHHRGLKTDTTGDVKNSTRRGYGALRASIGDLKDSTDVGVPIRNFPTT